MEKIRTFSTGAKRDTEQGKLDYEGFLSPLALKAYAEYMHKHRLMNDGTYRNSNDWKQGIPRDVYMKSAWRHFMDLWFEHSNFESREGLNDALCALFFNIQGYLHEVKRDEENAKRNKSGKKTEQKNK